MTTHKAGLNFSVTARQYYRLNWKHSNNPPLSKAQVNSIAVQDTIMATGENAEFLMEE